VHDKLDPAMQLSDFFDCLYMELFRSYRNEYVYKNVIASKLLLGRHSLNTSFMLAEFRVANCKADMVLLNGTSNAYEIKSEFDSIDRLERQVQAYRMIFDRIHVITSERQIEKVITAVNEDIGVMVLTNRNTLRTIRSGDSLKSRIEPSVVFDSLRRNEYIRILIKRFGSIPDVPNTRIYEACKKVFCRLSPEAAHDEMVNILKTRGRSRSLSEFVTGVPVSLKAVSLSCKLSRKEQASFLNLLDMNIGSCLLDRQS